MDPAQAKDRYRRLTEHFQNCLDLSPDLRRDYVGRVTGEDATLGKELEALLRQHSERSTPSPSTSSQMKTPAKRRHRRAPVGSILLGLGVSLLVILFVGHVWAVGRMEETLRRDAGQNLKSSLDLRVVELRAWAREQTALARRTLDDAALAESLAALGELAGDAEALKASPAAATLDARVRTAMGESGRGYVLLAPSGVALCSSDAGWVGRTVSSEGSHTLRRILLGEWIVSRPQSDSELFLGREAAFQRAAMFAGGPIRSARGQIVGIGLIHINPDPVYEILTSPSMEFLAFDEKGLLLNEIGRTEPLRKAGLMPMCRQYGSAFRVRLRDPGSDLRLRALPAAPADRWPPTLMAGSAAQGADGVDVTGQRDLRGQRVLQAWTWLPDWEMGVGVQQPEEEALAPLAPVRLGLWLSAMICAVSGLLIWVLSRRAGRRGVEESSPFGAYVIERRIGRGATADILLARHSYLKRPAALKVLNDRHPSADTVERFQREARLASRLGHPNTIQVYDYGRAPDGRLFLAMEYVEGLNLGQLVTLQHPLPVGRIVFILKQIAGALDEAHQAGLLHQDLKPSNIMVTCRGAIADVVKVLDFGTASQMSGDGEDVTRSDQILGTPAFMAPERIRAPKELDPRSDIYSFGAVAFHLITGRHVFESDGPTELVYQVLTSARPSPSQIRGERLPEQLENLVVDCLSLGLSSRPPSFRNVRERLKAVPLTVRWGREEAREWWEVNRERVSRFAQATT